MLAPTCNLEPAIGRSQRRDDDAASLQQRHPGAIGTQPRPTAAAQREQSGSRLQPRLAFRSGNTQLAVFAPAQPALAGMDLHATVAQALEPGAQQGRGFHIGGEYAAGAADEGVYAQAVDPFAQGSRVEGVQQWAQMIGALAIATDECGVVLGMGDVHAADASQQELAPDRGHGVMEI